MSEDLPAKAVADDADAERAPNPRKHYDSPEELRDDTALDLDTRENLLAEWKQDLDRRLESESEGMSAADPLSQERESRLVGELRSVSKALEEVVSERNAE